MKGWGLTEAQEQRVREIVWEMMEQYALQKPTREEYAKMWQKMAKSPLIHQPEAWDCQP